MADIIIDGKVKVYEVPAIADPAAPTTTELDAGENITDILTADGLVGFAPDTNEVDNSSLASTFNTRLPGRAAYSGTMLRLKKQSQAGDTIYDTLVREYATNIVVRRGVDQAQAWAASDEVEVYPIRCGEVRNLDPDPDTVQRYEVPVFMASEPELRATVAAGV